MYYYTSSTNLLSKRCWRRWVYLENLNKPKENLYGTFRKRKKALIIVSLVQESAEKANEEIEKEIFEELSKACLRFLG